MQTGIKRLVRSLAELGPEDSDLDLTQLSDRYRNVQEKDLVKRLDTVKYEIDSKDSFKLFGSDRIENVSRRSLNVCTECPHECLFSSCCQCFTSLRGGIYKS